MQLDDVHLSRNARFEILPLIDVIFLLLVFFIFMFLSMTVQRGLPLELPQIAKPQNIHKKSVQISINKTGDITVDGVAVSLEQLAHRINKDEARPIIIQGDRKAELGLALQVLEQLTLAGFSNIAFAADRPAKDSATAEETGHIEP